MRVKRVFKRSIPWRAMNKSKSMEIQVVSLTFRLIKSTKNREKSAKMRKIVRNKVAKKN